MNKEKVFFKTFGCRTNIFDTQLMISALKDFSYTPYEEDADIIVVNSCTVTNNADSGVRNYINRLQGEGKRIYFTGCGVKYHGQKLLDKQMVFGVFGHSLKESINELLQKNSSFYELGEDEFLDSKILGEFIGRSRAFIKIQEGCNFACSYCIIPQVRGKARSFPLESIREQVVLLVNRGFSEFILTGTNVGSYGLDLNLTITHLIQTLLDISGVKRLRIGSLEPSQIDGNFIECLSDKKIERHLHIALQHTSPKMLQIMNRQNHFREDLKLFETLSDMGFALGSDFIVGHPGETEEIWQEALSNFNLFPLTHIHSFIYSKREGTKSASMPMNILGNTAKERKKEIENIVKCNNYNFRQKMQQQKTPLEVLIEGDLSQLMNKKTYNGFDQFYNKIQLDYTHAQPNTKWLSINNYEVKQECNYANF